MIVVQEEGFEIEFVLCKVFVDLCYWVDWYVVCFKYEFEYKCFVCWCWIGVLLVFVWDVVEVEWCQFFFDLIEDYFDMVYDIVRCELIYFECSGFVLVGYLSVGDIVDVMIFKGLVCFEDWFLEFFVGDWLKWLVFEIIEEEFCVVCRVVFEDVVFIEVEFEVLVEDLIEVDQVMIEFYQFDEVLMLEDFIVDDGGIDFEIEVDCYKIVMVLYWVIVDFVLVECCVLYWMYLEDVMIVEMVDFFGLIEIEVVEIVENVGVILCVRFVEVGLVRDLLGCVFIEWEIVYMQCLFQLIEDCCCLVVVLIGEEVGFDI